MSQEKQIKEVRKHCAWCGKDLGKEAWNTKIAVPITHSICDHCAMKVLSQLDNPRHEFLDRLDVPVLMIDSKTLVAAGNVHAQNLLGKDIPQIKGDTPGNVVDCVHAKQAAGCGRSEHCEACKISQAVRETFETGKPCVRVKAYKDVQIKGEIKTLCIEITTQKVGKAVLLRIDEIDEKDK